MALTASAPAVAPASNVAAPLSFLKKSLPWRCSFCVYLFIAVGLQREGTQLVVLEEAVEERMRLAAPMWMTRPDWHCINQAPSTKIRLVAKDTHATLAVDCAFWYFLIRVVVSKLYFFRRRDRTLGHAWVFAGGVS